MRLKYSFLSLFMLVSVTMKAAWTDVTDLYFTNPSFEGNQTTGWVWNSNAASQKADYSCFEFWNGYFQFSNRSPFRLPPGHYRLSLNAFYRCGDFDAIYQNYLSGNENITASVFVESAMGGGKIAGKTVASVFSDPFDSFIPGCWNQGDNYYPNNMQTASWAFDDGKYLNTLEFDVVNEDDLFYIGLSCEDYEPSNWCIFDNFKLEYEGDIIKANAVSVVIDKEEIMVGESSSCYAEISPSNAHAQRVAWSSSNPNVASVSEEGVIFGLAPGVANIIATTIDGSNISASAQIRVKSDDDTQWVDVTSLFLTNPSFDNNSTVGWDWWSNANSQQANFDCFEFWNGIFTFGQELNGLIPGRYRLSVQGFYRTTENWTAYDAYQYGTENITAMLVAGDARVPMKSVYSFSFNDYNTNCWTPNGTDFYPDGMQSAAEAFSRGAYENIVTFESDGYAWIGLTNDNSTYSNWCIFDNFKLEYGGEVVLAENIEVTVENPRIIVGETTQCTAVLSPENTLFKKVNWSSSNPGVATVDANGLVTGWKPGTATIYASTVDGTNLQASVKVEVVDGSIDSNSLVINEIMAANVDEFVSPAFNFDGWIELYNTSSSPISLGGLFVSDNKSNLSMWRMPTNIGIVPPKGFKTIWFESNDISQINAPFKLDTDGGEIYISDESGHIIAQAQYPEAMERVSYARKTDGSEEWGFAVAATPGKTNNGMTFAATQLDAPVVDLPSQLFVGPLSVNVKIPAGCTLRYTTDGTLPTMQNGRTSNSGQFSVSQTTNYRFRLFANGNLPSRVTTRSYIYASQDYTLPVLSVVSDPRFLYDDSLGVMVRGVNGRPGNGQSGKCNWNMAWDRPVNFSYLDKEGEMVINQDVNLEMCGGWSRAWSPHAFKLKGSKELGGDKNLLYPFFEDKPYIRNRTLQVRNGGNDNVHRFKDPALQYIVQSSGIDIDCQSYQPVHEFINGQYIGVLNVREPNNKHFVYANYGWDEDEIEQFEMSPDSGYVQKCGSEEMFNLLVDELSRQAENRDTYAEICNLLDIDEYANYMATEFYLGNWDWPQNNVKGFRKTEDGKFRFILFDLDGSFNASDPFNLFLGKEIYTFDQLYPYELGKITEQIRFVTLFKNLLRNSDFRRRFIDAYCIIGGSVFEANRAIAIVDQLADRVNPAMSLEGLSVNNSANDIRNYVGTRLWSSISTLQNFWNLELRSTEPQRVSLRSNVDNAQLLINGNQVPTGKFNGYLFPPVTLTAVAPGGYTFQGWTLGAGNAKTIVPSGAVWHYYDKGSLDGTNWSSPSYAENNWKSGNAPLGYGQDGIATTLEYGNRNDKRPTAYFRMKVNLDKAPGRNDEVLMNFTVDDGFVLYINGTEAGRYNMPSGPVSYNTYASTYAPNNPDRGTIAISSSHFHSGENTIAVEVHNNSATSSDLMWDAAITMSSDEQPASYYSTDNVISLPEGDVSLTACYRQLTESEMRELRMAPVCINEVSGSNDSYINEYGKKGDWVELYNTTDEDIDVDGMFLSDDTNNPTKYKISKDGTNVNTVLPAHGYMLIWCDKQATTSKALHAPFKINGEGGFMMISSADRKWDNVIYYSAHDASCTVGRFPDGGKNVYLMNVPTIEKSNILSSYMTDVDQSLGIPEKSMYIASANGLRICYAGQQVIVRSEEVNAANVAIYTSDGRMVEQQYVTLNKGLARVDVSHLSQGFYIARALGEDTTQVACKFVK